MYKKLLDIVHLEKYNHLKTDNLLMADVGLSILL